MSERLTVAQIRSEVPPSCRIVAVSKLQTPTAIRELYRQGQRDFAENYLQEALPKIQELSDLKEIRWHFIGRIQSNKVRDVVGNFELLHSVDRLDLAKKISERAIQLGTQQAGLLQLNLSGENSKAGYSLQLLELEFSRLMELPGILWQGWMTMPPLAASPEESRRWFAQLRQVRDQYIPMAPQMTELSMGTSSDWRIAAEQGSTLIRVGTTLFGPRVAATSDTGN